MCLQKNCIDKVYKHSLNTEGARSFSVLSTIYNNHQKMLKIHQKKYKIQNIQKAKSIDLMRCTNTKHHCCIVGTVCVALQTKVLIRSIDLRLEGTWKIDVLEFSLSPTDPSPQCIFTF